MNDDVLAIVEASAARRWMGVLMMASLGGLLIFIALSSPPEPFWQIFLIITGLAALWMAEKMRSATRHRIELTAQEMRSSEGQVIARLVDIDKVERGLFVFKPSNGFLVRLRRPGPRIWRPGLWWCTGRKIGVGGVTSAGQTKAMSEILSVLLAKRDQDQDQDPGQNQDH
ncbi:MAG: hypothetical protein L3J36_03190 [Rhodobacteraceae bacterium]|nr:hypothetical protein [Paracoccaceae bacterium]